ncbi:MAG: zinc-dependent peptidase [Deltaproteobacteria bacterium]|nr:zinc-dependent peptidase [Deltaproteobacteria bacterium]
MFGLKQKQRQKLREQPFPEHWNKILQENVAYFHRLPAADQAELRGHIQIFLQEKKFVGCGGLEINDEIRVTIAAEACILLLHRKTDYYPTLNTIMVYPHHYYAPGNRVLPGGVVDETPQNRLGESWRRGPVILSWDDVNRSAHKHNDAHNVVFHEFAHQLDSESGNSNGAPLLPRRSMYSAWAQVLGEEYEHLISQLQHQHKTDIDAYGATNPAEFFAVISEAFFETPRPLQRRHPALYEQLALFYQQDPAQLPSE